MIVIRVGDDGPQYRGHGPVTIGRDESCDLQILDRLASRQHVRVRREGPDWVAEDLGSRNGTRIGDDRPITRALLRSGDVLRIGETLLTIAFDQTVPDLEIPTLRFTIALPAASAGEIRCNRETVTIGRHPSCDVVVDDPTVSRLHAVVAKTNAGYVINDQKATNAVYVGDPPERVTAAVLYDGQTLRLGSAVLRVHVPEEVGKAPEPPRISQATMMVEAVGPRPPADVVQARLAEAPLFRGFTEEDWKLFLDAYERDTELHIEHFSAGNVVCEAGRFDAYFRVVLKGCIEAQDPASGSELLTHTKGGFFGLNAAKKSLARTTRHIATEDSQVFCVPRHQIRYVERNGAARALLAERHKEESWRVMSAQLPLLEGVAADRIEDLMGRSDIDFYDKAGIVIVHEGHAADSVGIVRDGFLKVVKAQEGTDDRILGYLRAGDLFGESALRDDASRTASVVTAGKAEVVIIDRDAFRSLCGEHPELIDRLDRLREEREESRPPPALSRQLEKLGQGFIQADALLLMDLELCVKCDLCVQACEELHGESRLVRRGIELETAMGTHLAPAACRHCDDPLCMFSCPTGAIKRRPEGEIYIDYDLCTGVGACALACPYDNIHMIETHKFDAAQARKQRAQPDHEFFRPYPDQGVKPQGLLQRLLAFGRVEDPQAAPGVEDGRHVPASYPIKCDMCDGLPFMGCVHACPTGAAMRVDLDPEGIVGPGQKSAQSSGGKAA